MLEKYPSLGICVLVQFLPLSYSQGVCTWWLLHCTKRTDRKDLRDTFWRCHISVALKYCDKWWLSVQCNFCVFWQHAIAMKHTTFIMQVLSCSWITAQNYHINLHCCFSASKCEDTNSFAVYTMFRLCPARKYPRNPAAKWLQQMAPPWTGQVHKMGQKIG